MDGISLFALALAMALAAALYASVGHGGASAYLALMALFAVAPATMRPTALALNLLVAGIGSIAYFRAGQFNLRLFLLFALPAIPFAFLGGSMELPPQLYRPLVGITLWAAAARLAWDPKRSPTRSIEAPAPAIAIPVGALLGLLAGLTGTGGGIFLSPLILLLGWEEPRKTSGVAAAFILANSIAGLAGNLSSLGSLPAELPFLLAAVGIGGLAGAFMGARRLPRPALLRILALVLAIAGAKLIFT